MPEKHIGKVVQVMGPVLDIRFKDGELPALLNAIELENNGKKLIVEVAQHIGDNVVRCIAVSLSRSPLVTSASAAYSTCSVIPLMSSLLPRMRSTGPSTVRPLPLMSRSLPLKFSRPASRSLTLFAPTPRAARSVCSAVPVSARPF